MLPSWFYSLQFRLTAGFAVALALSLTGVSLYAAQATRQETERFAQEVDEARALNLEQLVSNTYQEEHNWDHVQATLEQAATLLGWRLTMTDTQGDVVADSHGMHAPPFRGRMGQGRQQLPIVIGESFIGSLFLAAGREGRDFPRFSAAFVDERKEQRPPAGYSWFDPPPETVTVPVSSDTDVYSSTPEVAPEPQIDRLAASFQDSLLLAGLAAGAGGIFLVSLGTRRTLAPVRALSAAARGLGRGDLAQRVAIRGRDEIGQLGRTFNEMAGALQQAERQRRTMTADIAHELRTPLSNVQGYLEAITDGVVEPDPSTINTLHEQTLHLSRLIEDLRLTATAEAGALHLERTTLRLDEIAEETVDAFLPRASEKGVRLTVNAEPGLPEISADHTRLHQVVTNLLDNALTHTPERGTITVSIGRSDEGQLRLDVADTGSGISPDRLPYVFDQFYRVDPSRSRETGGAGLGLTIVKRLVEAHGGRVTAESEPGRGTRISVHLPVYVDD